MLRRCLRDSTSSESMQNNEYKQVLNKGNQGKSHVRIQKSVVCNNIVTHQTDQFPIQLLMASYAKLINKSQMEQYESSDESLKPKNSKSISDRDTTAKRRPHSEKKTRRDVSQQPDLSVIQYVQDLFARKQKAEIKGKYKLATNCKNKLQHLKDHILSQRLKEIREDHKQDRKQIKQAHQSEMDRVEQAWNRLSESYDRKIQQMVYKWQIKKDNELKRLQKEFDKINQRQFKARSKDISDLKTARQYFIKAQDYQQARLIQKEIRARIEQLLERASEDIQQKINSMKSNIYQKHIREQAVLRHRIQKAKDQQNLHCSRQKRKLQKKYQNVLKRLQRQQFLELQNLEVSGKSQGNPLNLSRRNAEWIIENSGEL